MLNSDCFNSQNATIIGGRVSNNSTNRLSFGTPKVCKAIDNNGNECYCQHQHQHEQGTSPGSHITYHKLNEYGVEEMSFATIVHFGDFAIAAADSRITIKYTDGSPMYNDNCKKIVPISGTNIIALSTGTAIFNNKSFEQIAKGVTTKELFSINTELSQLIKSCFSSEERTSLIVAECRAGYTAGIVSTIQASGITSDLFNFDDKDIGIGVYSGQTWATNLAAKMDLFRYHVSEQNAINSVRNFMNKLAEFSIIAKNDGGTIGGHIDTVLLRSGKEPEFLPRTEIKYSL
jgi:hypothetical protein